MKRIYFALGSFIGLPIFLVLYLLVKVPLMAAALVGLAYAVVYIAVAWRAGYLTKLDWAVLAYFLTGSVLLLVHEPSGRFVLSDHSTTFIFLSLFCAAFFPVVLGFEPFTVAFARRTTSPEVWETALFKDINRIMTLTWAGLFLVAAAISLNRHPVFQYVIPTLMPPILGIPFNRRFPEWYLKRLGQQGTPK